ncbi:MAG TPA: MoaD/ThiS family protein [Alphaproteobacteria bacterium]|jgi:sulfur carrier protein ThiS|nr:MoaD/ThiS family protein [Alphaproteobacteria bacterium]
MKITVKLFALLSTYLPEGATGHEAKMEVAEGATPALLIERLRLPPKMTHLVLVNGVYVPPSERARFKLSEGDALAIWPPVAGG